MKKRAWLLGLLLLLLCPMLADASGTLSYGSEGAEVVTLQERLAELGYYSDIVSGNFLDNTRAAVRAFQQQNGLTVDGVVGTDTWQTLFEDAEVADAFAAPRPQRTPAPAPYQVGVDVTNQVVTVYGLDERGQYGTIVKRMICSTGTERDPTPPGSYIINGATSRWCYFPKWGTHAQYWTRIDAYNAFHSVIYSQADTMALSTGSYTGLGKRASHGCIRLMVEDAKWIYDNVGKGTEVVVYEGFMDEELTKSLKIPELDTSVMLPYPTAGPTMEPIYNPTERIVMSAYTLEYGSEGEAVYWLQCRLSELGYYGGSITGGYYGGTVEAVKMFQRASGLVDDGKAGEVTQKLLYEGYLQPTAPPTVAPTPTTAPVEAVWFEPDAEPTSTPRFRRWAE